MPGPPHDHDLGLRHDLPRLLGRRHALGLLAGAGLVTLAGCTGTAPGTAAPGTAAPGTAAPGTAAPGTTADGTSPAGATGVAEIPQETAGPFPGDGSNGPDVLNETGVVRGDLTRSVGSLSGVAAGVPLTVALTIVNATDGTPLPGATVYLWHCDRDGRYSLYEVPDQNYLRGVQAADAAGRVTFTTIFPGAYRGRWPHAHFEVYADLAAATGPDTAIATSQMALPAATCDEVYATDGYAASVANMGLTSLESDGVFRDGFDAQLAAVRGTVADGLTATLTIGVDT